MLVKLFSIISLIADFCICYFGSLVTNILDFWKPVVLFFVAFIAVIVLHLVIICILALFVNVKKPVQKPSFLYRWYIDKTLELLLFVLRVKVKVDGIEKMPTDKKFLFVSNHLSGFDPITAIVGLMKFNIVFVAKPEIFKLPIVVNFIHKSGFLAIDRENARKAMKTIHKATDYVKSGVASVGIYPEGTRSKTGELLEFKDGVFYVCKKAECPLVVATVENTEKIFKNFPFKSTTVNININEVIEPESFEDKSTHELSEEVRVIMQKNI